MTTVTAWLTPHTVKALQCFLGFTNCYGWVIQSFSSTATHLIVLLQRRLKKLLWNQAAEEAFIKIKSTFITTLNLKHPDCSSFRLMHMNLEWELCCPRTLEISLNSTQWLTSLRNWVKLWHGKPWTIGGQTSFWGVMALAGVGYSTFIHLHKKFKSWIPKNGQVTEPMLSPMGLIFFMHFNFMLSYRPGSKNTKADLFSCLYSLDNRNQEPKSIVLSSCFINAVVWDMERDIRKNPTHCVPQTGPSSQVTCGDD